MSSGVRQGYIATDQIASSARRACTCCPAAPHDDATLRFRWARRFRCSRPGVTAARTVRARAVGCTRGRSVQDARVRPMPGRQTRVRMVLPRRSRARPVPTLPDPVGDLLALVQPGGYEADLVRVWPRRDGDLDLPAFTASSGECAFPSDVILLRPVPSSKQWVISHPAWSLTSSARPSIVRD